MDGGVIVVGEDHGSQNIPINDRIIEHLSRLQYGLTIPIFGGGHPDLGVEAATTFTFLQASSSMVGLGITMHILPLLRRRRVIGLIWFDPPTVMAGLLAMEVASLPITTL